MLWAFVGLLVASIGGFLLYEVLALANHQAGDTISEIVWHVTQHYPLVPFLFGLTLGLLSGHFFWQRAS